MITSKDAHFITDIFGDMLTNKKYTPEQRQVFIDIESAFCKVFYEMEESGKKPIMNFDAMRILESGSFKKDKNLQKFYEESRQRTADLELKNTLESLKVA